MDYDAIYARILDGTVTFDDALDLFMESMTGQASGLTREEFRARLVANLPTQDKLAAALRSYVEQLPPALRPESHKPTPRDLH